MTRSLPEQEVLKYLAHGHPLPAAEGSSTTQNTFGVITQTPALFGPVAALDQVLKGADIS